MKLSNKFWIIAISICLVLLIIVIVGFVSFSNRKPEVIEKEENGGYITLNYTSEFNGLTILKAEPTSDSVGIKNMDEGQYFDFSVDVDIKKAPKVEYEISVIKDDTLSTIDDDDIRIYLEKEESGSFVKVFGPEKFTPSKNFSEIGSEIGSMVLFGTKKTKSHTDNYRLRIWLSDKAVVKDGRYSVKVDIKARAK